MIGIGPGIGVSRPRGLWRAIRALFAASEVGVWYDPSDFPTLFQDSAGTTPVTAAGQTVGLMLDKSKGLVLGPELMTNGDFSSSTGWTVVGAGLSISGGTLNAVSVLNGTEAYQTNKLVSGRFYKVSFTVLSITGGVRFSNRSQTGPTVSTAGSYESIFTGTNTNAGFQTVGDGSSYVVDNISVKEIPGYHATQATSTARPILGRHPITGRRNLLTYTEDFSNAVWTKSSSATVTGTNQVNLAAVASSRVEQLYSSTVGTVWVAKFTVSGTGQCYLGIFDNGGAFPVTYTSLITLTATPTTYTITRTHSDAAASSVGFRIINNSSAAATVIVASTQLELGSTPTAYQKVVSTYDVTEAGVNDAYHLKFDGVDDFMVTPSIDFSATGKMSVFAAIKQLAASIGIIYEVGTGVAPYLFSAVTATGQFDTKVAGATSNVEEYETTGAINVNKVISVSVDMQNATAAGTLLTRINGSDPALTTTGSVPLGSASVGSNAIYIGMRAGTSLPFNGHLYSLIVRGALSDANQISAAEAYVNSRTGAY